MKVFLITMLLLGLMSGPDNVATRFAAPEGYQRVAVKLGSFAAFLQNLPLKPVGTPTRIFSGETARTDAYTAAVVDMSVGTQDLQQCADAVMRLRGEYLYRQQKYDKIAFHFTSGFNCDFVHYANGYRYTHDHWVLKGKRDYSYLNFMRYMTLVFSYAGTLSLQRELIAVKDADHLQAGDVFIRGGSPGHCFIVMDVVENTRHQRQFLLAQSFMPAQNIQVLQYHSPWFRIDKISDIPYGELISRAYLKRFED